MNRLINTNISFCIFTTYLQCNLFSISAVLLAEMLLNFFLPAVGMMENKRCRSTKISQEYPLEPNMICIMYSFLRFHLSVVSPQNGRNAAGGKDQDNLSYSLSCFKKTFCDATYFPKAFQFSSSGLENVMLQGFVCR